MSRKGTPRDGAAASQTLLRLLAAVRGEAAKLERERQLGQLLAGAADAVAALDTTSAPSPSTGTVPVSSAAAKTDPDTDGSDAFSEVMEECVTQWLSTLANSGAGVATAGPSTDSRPWASSSLADQAARVSLLELTSAGYAPAFAHRAVCARVGDITQTLRSACERLDRLLEHLVAAKAQWDAHQRVVDQTFCMRDTALVCLEACVTSAVTEEVEGEKDLPERESFWSELARWEMTAYETLRNETPRVDQCVTSTTTSRTPTASASATSATMDSSRLSFLLRKITELASGQEEQQRWRVACRERWCSDGQ